MLEAEVTKARTTRREGSVTASTPGAHVVRRLGEPEWVIAQGLPPRHTPRMDAAFTAPLWRWKPDASWFFVTLPADLSDEIEDRFGGGPGFGSIRVEVRVGATAWATSLFPSTAHEAYILPIKKQVRTREGLDEGDAVTVQLRVVV